MRKLLASLLIAVSCFMLSGCTIPFITDGRSYKLDSKWKPLETVEEATDKLFAEGMTTTIGNHCYVPDLAQWQRDYPTNSVEQTALLLHEQVHAKRQLAYPGGIELWIARYTLQPSFRWDEEKLGYEQEIRYLYAHGRFIDTNFYALALSHDYNELGGHMVIYSDALAWVNDLIKKIQSGN